MDAMICNALHDNGLSCFCRPHYFFRAAAIARSTIELVNGVALCRLPVQCPYMTRLPGKYKLGSAARGYLDLQADDRFEARLPQLLKRHAETVAKSRGETLSEYVLSLLAERVAEDITATQEWRLSAPEQAQLLRALANPAPTTAALRAASRRAEELFGL